MPVPVRSARPHPDTSSHFKAPLSRRGKMATPARKGSSRTTALATKGGRKDAMMKPHTAVVDSYTFKSVATEETWTRVYVFPEEVEVGRPVWLVASAKACDCMGVGTSRRPLIHHLRCVAKGTINSSLESAKALVCMWEGIVVEEDGGAWQVKGMHAHCPRVLDARSCAESDEGPDFNCERNVVWHDGYKCKVPADALRLIREHCSRKQAETPKRDGAEMTLTKASTTDVEVKEATELSSTTDVEVRDATELSDTMKKLAWLVQMGSYSEGKVAWLVQMGSYSKDSDGKTDSKGTKTAWVFPSGLAAGNPVLVFQHYSRFEGWARSYDKYDRRTLRAGTVTSVAGKKVQCMWRAAVSSEDEGPWVACEGTFEDKLTMKPFQVDNCNWAMRHDHYTIPVNLGDIDR